MQMSVKCGLPATQYTWTHPALTQARQASTWFIYPGSMEG